MDKIDLKNLENTLAACNRCGFCTSYCPTYQATGSESHSPRGRNQAFRALLDGTLTNPAEAKDIIDTCLLCGECTSVCFSEVPTAKLMVQARNMLNEKTGIPWGLKFIIQKILPRPTLLYWISKLALLGKKLKISFFLRKIGILQRVAPALANADSLLDSVSLEFGSDNKIVKKYLESTYANTVHDHFLAVQKAKKLREKSKPIAPALEWKAKLKPERPKLALIPVCGSQYLQSSIMVSTVKLLEKLKKDFIIPDAACCGLPAASYGMVEEVNKTSKKHEEKFKTGQYETLIADDSSCVAHYKESGIGVQELSQFFLNAGLTDLLKNKHWKGGLVAYHDPCKAQYGQNIVQPPRTLLNAIPGLGLIPISDADQCCGGGGTYSFVHPDISQEVLDSKIKNIIATKCEIVVTSSASCLTQLKFGLKKRHSRIEALHISEFLVRVLESS